MSYDLIPRNKKLKTFSIGAFSWPWMLNAGVGLIIGTGPAMESIQYSFRADSKGRSPQGNDGYYVTAFQAKAMAMAARGLVTVERFKLKQYRELPEEERTKIENRLDRQYIRLPVREDFIDKTEAFAEWAEKSRGFRIY